MPAVRPFTALMYRRTTPSDVGPRVAPPYDVISPEYRRALLARDPLNVVAVDLPEGTDDPSDPDNRYARARALWSNWRKRGVIVHDIGPAIYVLEQSWMHQGIMVRRRALIAAVRLHDFAERVILPHERTLPKAIHDRLELTRACRANLSQVLGLYSDPAGETDELLDAATETPLLLEATDDDGVRSRVWAIRDEDTIDTIVQILSDKQVFIADGHHRYTTALAYRDERRRDAGIAGEAPGDQAFDYVMMALVNMDDPDLIVLPTHRVATLQEGLDTAGLVAALATHFELVHADERSALALEMIERPAMHIKTRAGLTAEPFRGPAGSPRAAPQVRRTRPGPGPGGRSARGRARRRRPARARRTSPGHA